MAYLETIFGVVAVGIAYIAWARISLNLPVPRGPAHARFVQSNDRGNFGELLTAVILTQQGWRQMPSKLGGGGHGIDGLFVRPSLLGFDILITESKTNVSPYKSRQLESAKLIRTVGELYLIGEMDRLTADSIVRGLKRHAPSIRKECWRHLLVSGRTLIRRANRKGELSPRALTRDHAYLMESLTTMLAIFDREEHYLQTTPE
jgi:hypothetical protein